MSEQVSPKDWEELSAYLDEQLSRNEKERFETRLRKSPQLQSALNELKELRTLLKSQPVIRAPRNYSLSADTEGIRIKRRKSGFVFPALSFAAAVASILFVFVFISDLTYEESRVSQIRDVRDEQLEMQSMEKALPESVASDEIGRDIGEVQAVPLESADEQLGIMEALSEGTDISPPEALAVEPESQIESQVVGRSENVLKFIPDLVWFLLSNRLALRLLEAFLILTAISAAMGAIYFYRSRE